MRNICKWLFLLIVLKKNVSKNICGEGTVLDTSGLFPHLLLKMYLFCPHPSLRCLFHAQIWIHLFPRHCRYRKANFLARIHLFSFCYRGVSESLCAFNEQSQIIFVLLSVGLSWCPCSSMFVIVCVHVSTRECMYVMDVVKSITRVDEGNRTERTVRGKGDRR